MKTLTNWFSDNKKSPWLIIGVAIALLLVVVIATGGGGGVNLSGTAGAGQACDTSDINSNIKFGKIIDPEGMNVRTGPGTDYDKVEPGLPYCTAFEMLGRNAESTWLEVRNENLRGWIKYSNESQKINMNIYNLPITSAGSQQQPVSGDIPEGIHVTIEDNVAHVTISDLPAGKAFYVRLRPDGYPTKEINFYQGMANGNGEAQFQQTMPFIWEDGSKVEYGRLVMEVFVTDTKESAGSTVILYSR